MADNGKPPQHQVPASKVGGSSNHRRQSTRSRTKSSGDVTEKSNIAFRKSQRPQRAHYTTEKRYRFNLNNSFEELRQCLADARSFLDKDSGSEKDGNDSSAEHQERAPRMSKAKVLSEAVDYIRYLEDQNDRDTDYIQTLESQLGLCQTHTLGLEDKVRTGF